MLFRALVAAVAALLVVALPAEARSRAGVAVKDATWHVGASAGQFSDETGPVVDGTVDPHGHTTKKRLSDGVALRTSTRALVVEDKQGDRVAVVAQDLYLSQDFLNRRVAHLLAEHDRLVALGLEKGPQTGITQDNLAITASHNHNTPFYSTPGWGTWIFQDVLDVRFYDYMARRMASAVITATKRLRPVRMGGATRTFDEVQAHTYGPKVADDGTPAGQPFDHTTKQLSVVRFDDVSNPRKPRPYVNWVVFGVHPEWTWGYDLINGDITHAAARMVDRDLRTTSVFSQRETGASGPHKDTRAHPPEARREFQDNGFAQLDRGARLLADGIKATLRDIERGKPERNSAYQRMTSDFDVAAVAQRFAPPATRPYPGVSNCNTASLFHADPRLPILGLPDCYSVRRHGGGEVIDAVAPYSSELYDGLKAAGVPIPEAYSGTALTAVEEQATVKLQAFKLGDTVATFCPCEQFTDTALNIESRLDEVAGNLHTGWDWAEHETPAGRDWCVPGDGGTWTCADPRRPSADLAPVSDKAYRRMRAQIHNDASGWETDLATLGSEAEPDDPAKIKGNFTHEEFADRGFGLVLSVGMANDYWGYTPEYRDMRAFDHYRKALNGLGLHGADFLATRLSRLAASLHGGPGVAPTPLDRAYLAEDARAEALAQALGEAGRAATRIYEKGLPADGGKPSVVEEPAKTVERFSAAHVSWIGGSNYADLPRVVVQRRVGRGWKSYGDTHGDVQFMVDFPEPAELPAYRQGAFEWRWTASFETFSSDISQPDASGKDRRSTPAGEYRFVILGDHRRQAGAEATPYRLESRSFEVRPWSGLAASDLRVEDDRRVSFAPARVEYPDSYASPFRFIHPARKTFTYGLADVSRHQVYCPRCSFRPWADVGEVTQATVRLGDREVPAFRDEDGRWRTRATLRPGETPAVGELRDEFGNTE